MLIANTKCLLGIPLKKQVMKNDIVKRITSNAVIAAIYFVLTVAISPFAFGPIQVRVSEFLVLLCFFRKDFTIGLTIGCALANWLAPGAFGGWDILIGSFATLISCLGICLSKHLLIATIYPVLANGIIIGLELYYLYNISDFGLWGGIGFVALGEFISVSIIGYIIVRLLARREFYLNVINAKQNREFKW